MSYRRLFVLVEGDDDERFVLAVLTRTLEEKYDWVGVWKYAQQRPSKVAAFLRSAKAMAADYIYLVDINRAPCVTHRKEQVTRRCRQLDEDRICVVIAEIESWYLAGLDATTCKALAVPDHGATEKITKERFDAMRPRRFDSRVDFMVELLKCFSIEVGTQRNRSLRYFVERFDC